MSKVSLTGTYSHPLKPACCPSLALRRPSPEALPTRLLIAIGLSLAATTGFAQETKPFVYPIAVAVQPGSTVADDVLYVVDLELPGVWQINSDEKSIYAMGSKRFRETLNRPRCVAIHPGGGILVGDSATREVYHISAPGAVPKPLSGGRIGVPMTIAVSPDAKSIFVGDAEKRAIVVIPAEGQPKDDPVQWVARVNARGMAFRDENTLVAVTPDEASVRIIDTSQPYGARPDEIVDNPAVTTLLDKRTFEFPNGLAARDDSVYITDGYGKTVYSVDAKAGVAKLLSGDPLQGPVGIAASPNAIWVADPQTKSILAIEDGHVTRTVK